MKANKFKSILLVGVLLVPALIFVFLKSFGSNQFDVPVFYASGVSDTLSTDCIRSTTVPYTVNTRPASQQVYKIYHFENEPSDQLNFRLEELERVQNAMAKDNPILLFSFLNNPSITPRAFERLDDRISFDPGFWSIRPLDSLTWNVFKGCELVMDRNDDRVVLVDLEEKIRGYYDISDREETDRLILELKILLSQTQ